MKGATMKITSVGFMQMECHCSSPIPSQYMLTYTTTDNPIPHVETVQGPCKRCGGIMPPKPKKMVTKEAEWVGDKFIWDPPIEKITIPRISSRCIAVEKTFTMPYSAKNVRCTYEVEE